MPLVAKKSPIDIASDRTRLEFLICSRQNADIQRRVRQSEIWGFFFGDPSGYHLIKLDPKKTLLT